MSFNFLVNFWNAADENGSMTWTFTDQKISVLYYFNNKNINLQKMLSLLKSMAEACGLGSRGWKLPFVMQVSNSEHRNYDYFKRIEYVVKNDFFIGTF